MTNALTLITPSDIMTTARALIASGFLPRSLTTVDQVFTLITMSQELQVGMWQAINGINIIQGKPTVSPQLMLALINRSGLLEDMTITEGADYCEVTMKRHGRSAYTYRFTDADAKAMGLSDKDNWKKQRHVMRKWRTVSGCSRVVFPDVIMGLYTTEEIAPDNTTVTDDGETIYTAPITVERPAEPASVEPQTVMIESVTRKMKSDQSTDFYMLGCANNSGTFTAYVYTRDLFTEAGYAPAKSWNTAELGESFVPHYGLCAEIRHNGKAWTLVQVWLTDDAAKEVQS